MIMAEYEVYYRIWGDYGNKGFRVDVKAHSRKHAKGKVERGEVPLVKMTKEEKESLEVYAIVGFDSYVKEYVMYYY